MLPNPSAIVDHLLAAAEARPSTAALPAVDLAVIEELKRRVDATKLRNAHQALAIAEVGLRAATQHPDPLVAGLAMWAYGNALFHLSRFQEALAAFQRAETFYNPEQHPLEITRLRINQIAVLQDMGAFQEALAVANDARQSCQQIGPVAEPFLALLEMNSGAVYHQLGRSAEALAAYERGRAILVRRGNRVETARIDINRANVLQEMGRFDEAVALYSASRAALEQAGLGQEVARAEHNLGKLAYRRGHYQAALRHLEAARAGYAAIPNPLEVAKSNLYRALVYRDLNLLNETLELAAAAERAFVRADTRWERAMALLIAGSAQARLQQFAAAERMLLRARRLLHAQGASERLPALDLERAELLLNQGRAASARRIAARVARQVAPETWPALVVRADILLAMCELAAQPARLNQARRRAEAAVALAERHDLPEQAAAIATLARVHEYTGAIEQARAAYASALAAVETLRARLPRDTLHLAFLHDKLPIYHAAARLNLEQHDPIGGLHALSLALSAPIPQAPDDGPPDLADQLRTLREQWHWQQSRIDDIAERGARSDTAHYAAAERSAALERAIADLLLRRDAAAQTSQAPQGASPIAAADFLSALQARLAAAEGLLVGAPMGDHVALVLVTPTALRWHLAPAPTLERTLRAWRFQIQHSYAAGAPTPSITALNAHLQRFYTALIAPLAADLEHLQRLTIAIDPAWHDLPLAAAFDGAGYLVERVTLRYISAPGALLDQQPAADTPHSTSSLVIGHSDGGRLGATLQEAHQIAALRAQAGPVQLLLEAEATPARVAAALPAAGMVHVAAHAVFRPDNPRFSWIRLHDGRLAVADLEDLRFTQRPLVFLSACETGRGLPRGGGLLGMGRALLLAGASAVCVSLWPAADAGAAALMPAVHRTLLGAREPAAALAAAQRHAIDAGSHPFDWAGFIWIER
jgi:CHAT domain-containing protein